MIRFATKLLQELDKQEDNILLLSCTKYVIASKQIKLYGKQL
jgi:hypothetical protein